MQKMISNFIVEVLRAGIQEKRFYGWITHIDEKQNVLRSLRIPDYRCFMRSCEKPIQASCSIESGAIEKFKLEPPDLALSFSSHVGSAEHIRQLESLLERIGITEDDLLCGSHPPLDQEERHRLIKSDLKPRTLHNNCSGKHIFAIAACKAHGWDYSNYTDFDHPLQKRIMELIKKYCNPNEIHLGIDGCGMPVHAMFLTDMGVGFSRFFDGSSPEAELIADAVCKYPHLAGGHGRIDSEIIKATNGKLIAKVGAEGLIIVTPRHSGEALVVKTSDGNDSVRNIIVVEALKQLGWFEKDPLEYEGLNPFTQTAIYNHRGQMVGQYNFMFSI